MIQELSSESLICAYRKALALKLDSHFIFLLEEELQKRNLPIIRAEISEV